MITKAVIFIVMPTKGSGTTLNLIQSGDLLLVNTTEVVKEILLDVTSRFSTRD